MTVLKLENQLTVIVLPVYTSILSHELFSNLLVLVPFSSVWNWINEAAGKIITECQVKL